MAITHVDLALTTGLNDGTSWTNAYNGGAGLVTAANATAGDTVYVKNTQSEAASKVIAGPLTFASLVNPVRLIGVKSATTNEGGSIVQSDLIPGIRTGDSTRAYAQTSGNAPPTVTITGSSDVTLRGALYVYGIVFESADNVSIAEAVLTSLTLEECKFTVSGGGDLIRIGFDVSGMQTIAAKFIHSLLDATSGTIEFNNNCQTEFFDCDIDGTVVGTMVFVEGISVPRFYGCDLSGCSASGIFNIAGLDGGGAELWNCKMPASHTLTTGTANGLYMIANYGSEDSASLDSADSEQALEIHTHEGTVDIETTVIRTGGADDEATDSGGPFAWALVPNNVTDNFVGVVSPWMEKWVLGDGTAKTATVFFANGAAESAANRLEDDEIYLEVMFPDEAGSSIYQYLPNDGAPSDGGGRMQLLGTATDIATDSSTWGSGGNNKQKFEQSIAPDYRGLVRARVHYSKSSGPTLYIDPAMTVA